MPAVKRSAVLRYAFALIAASVLTPAAAFGYIDPMAGSVVLQALIAGILGAALTAKGLGSKLKETARRLFKRLKD